MKTLIEEAPMPEPTAPPADPQAALYAALARAQADMPNVPKRGKAAMQGRTYTYMTLDDVVTAAKPILAANGLALASLPVSGGLLWRLTHTDGGIAEWLCELPFPIQTPHAWGGALTYARRYTLAGLLGIATEDDDDAQEAQAQAVSAPAAKSAPKPADQDPAKEEAMQGFWKAWAKAGLPNWKSQKDAARSEAERIIRAALGTAKYMNQLSGAEIVTVTEHILGGIPAPDPEPPDPNDPFADV
jgi:hypothetical protein